MSAYEEQVSELQQQIEPSVAQLRDVVADLGRQPSETGISLFLEPSHVYYVAQEIERLDRELRRAARAVREGKPLPLALSLAESIAERRGLVPARGEHPKRSVSGLGVDSPATSSLRLAAAGTGSTDLLLLPLGALVTLFASDELTAIANALAWSGPVRYLRTWRRERRDPLAGVTASQAFEILRQAGRDPELLLGPPSAEVEFPDGAVARGRRVVITRHYPDGTSEVIEASS